MSVARCARVGLLWLRFPLSRLDGTACDVHAVPENDCTTCHRTRNDWKGTQLRPVCCLRQSSHLHSGSVANLAKTAEKQHVIPIPAGTSLWSRAVAQSAILAHGVIPGSSHVAHE